MYYSRANQTRQKPLTNRRTDRSRLGISQIVQHKHQNQNVNKSSSVQAAVNTAQTAIRAVRRATCNFRLETLHGTVVGKTRLAACRECAGQGLYKYALPAVSMAESTSCPSVADLDRRMMCRERDLTPQMCGPSGW